MGFDIVHQVNFIEKIMFTYIKDQEKLCSEGFYHTFLKTLKQMSWRSLENIRNDATLMMSYKNCLWTGFCSNAWRLICIISSTRLSTTRKPMHPFFFRQDLVHPQPINYYEFSYLAIIVLWNSFLTNMTQAPTQDQFRQAETNLCHNF